VSARLTDAELVELRDGRKLAYAEAGDPAGWPIVVIHGTPGCRDPDPWAEAAERAGARIILPDRPGYGRSDFHPDQTLLDWPRDVEELADVLPIDRFAVLGISGGGPYAAACGYALASRLSGVAIVCGVGPFWDVPELDAAASEHSGLWIRELIDLARVDPAAAAEHAREECELDAEMIARDPDEWITYWFEGDHVAQSDRQRVADPDVRARTAERLSESLRAGPEGYIQDELILATRPWGFGASEIGARVYVWHGEDDTLVPVESARYLARTIPNCAATFFPGEGHMLPDHTEEFVRALVDEARADLTHRRDVR
jgi:pimeloyl-ACP methyl ester carboxylesterase